MRTINEMLDQVVLTARLLAHELQPGSDGDVSRARKRLEEARRAIVTVWDIHSAAAAAAVETIRLPRDLFLAHCCFVLPNEDHSNAVYLGAANVRFVPDDSLPPALPALAGLGPIPRTDQIRKLIGLACLRSADMARLYYETGAHAKANADRAGIERAAALAEIEALLAGGSAPAPDADMAPRKPDDIREWIAAEIKPFHVVRDALMDALGKVERRLDGMAERLDSIETKHADLDRDQRQADRNINSLATPITQLAGRLNAIESGANPCKVTVPPDEYTFRVGLEKAAARPSFLTADARLVLRLSDGAATRFQTAEYAEDSGFHVYTAKAQLRAPSNPLPTATLGWLDHGCFLEIGCMPDGEPVKEAVVAPGSPPALRLEWEMTPHDQHDRWVASCAGDAAAAWIVELAPRRFAWWAGSAYGEAGDLPMAKVAAEAAYSPPVYATMQQPVPSPA